MSIFNHNFYYRIITKYCLSGTDEERLRAIDRELGKVTVEIQRLNARKTELTVLRDKLHDNLMLTKSKTLAAKDWNRRGIV